MLKNANVYDSSEIAELYVTYRPSWDDADIVDTILSFCREQESAEFSLALDVGCGSGQSAVPLTKHFNTVMGLDISPAMLSRAPTHIPNLSFRVGQGEDLSFVSSDSVDLVLASVAAHWMDLEQFHGEVGRVLKPGGALVVMTHEAPRLDDPHAQEIYEAFNGRVLENHTPFHYLREVQKLFQTYATPFPGSRRVDGLKAERTWTVDQFVGFLSSMTLTHFHCLQHLSHTPPYDIKQRLQEIYRDEKGEERKIKVTFPILFFMGHKPQA